MVEPACASLTVEPACASLSVEPPKGSLAVEPLPVLPSIPHLALEERWKEREYPIALPSARISRPAYITCLVCRSLRIYLPPIPFITRTSSSATRLFPIHVPIHVVPVKVACLTIAILIIRVGSTVISYMKIHMLGKIHMLVIHIRTQLRIARDYDFRERAEVPYQNRGY